MRRGTSHLFEAAHGDCKGGQEKIGNKENFFQEVRSKENFFEEAVGERGYDGLYSSARRTVYEGR